MSRFLNERFRSLEGYTPGEQPGANAFIKLNTNESPYPPSPEVIAAISGAEIAKLNLYPDPTGQVLKEKIAKLYGVSAKSVFLSNGSDEILNFAFMAFCDQGKNGVVFPEISYGFYPVYANLYHIPYETMALRADFSIDYHDFCHAEAMVVIANPNAPTGMVLKREEVIEILETNADHIVLIDEAYIDFGGESMVSFIEQYSNLLVCMTFSKSRSMAGARLGFAIAKEEIIEDLEKIKFSTNPYNINRLTLLAGEAAIDSHEYYKKNAKKIVETREKITTELEALGFQVLPSQANFIFTRKDGMEGAVLYQRLKEKGVLVRHFQKPPIEDFIRVTIGETAQMDIFMEKLKEILMEGVIL